MWFVLAFIASREPPQRTSSFFSPTVRGILLSLSGWERLSVPFFFSIPPTCNEKPSLHSLVFLCYGDLVWYCDLAGVGRGGRRDCDGDEAGWGGPLWWGWLEWRVGVSGGDSGGGRGRF